MEIRLYDTFRSKDGKTWRAVEVSDKTEMVTLQRCDCGPKGVKLKGGKKRIVSFDAIGEGKPYRKLDIPPVTVTYQEPKMKNAPQPSVKVETKQVPTPSEKAAQIEKQTVTGYNDKGKDEQIVNLKKTIGKMQQHIDQLKQTNRELHNIIDGLNRELEDIRLKEEPVDIEALREDLKIAQKLAMSRGDQNDVLADELDEEHAKRILLEHKLAGITEFIKAILEPRRVM